MLRKENLGWKLGRWQGAVGAGKIWAAPNRCLVDLGEPEKEELLAVGKEEGRERGDTFSFPACSS